jgi:L-ascorbate metabolism protein UlaG (beta-lactamase superfamily)
VLDRVTWFKNSSFVWRSGDLAIYVDPWGIPEDAVPADVIFITHTHYDHFIPEDIDKVRTPRTALVAPGDVAKELSGDISVVSPGDAIEAGGLKVQCVPAYNVQEDRLDFHPRSNQWVGYVVDLGDGVYYHAGDTDHLPELESIRADVAFLPAGGTFTMDAQQAAGLAKAMTPGTAVPMHYGFVSGSSKDGESFREAAAPVPVEVFEPVNPFERP